MYDFLFFLYSPSVARTAQALATKEGKSLGRDEVGAEIIHAAGEAFLEEYDELFI